MTQFRMAELKMAQIIKRYVRSDWRSRLSAAALKARVLGSNPGGVGGIAVLGKLLTDHASVASAV